MPKAEPVYLVAVDHDGNEIGSYGTEKASAFFLKAARGKVCACARESEAAAAAATAPPLPPPRLQVRSLLKTKDYGSVATGGVSGRVSLAALSSGATKEYPVVGCLMISYTTPTGTQGVGFFSVAGCKSVGDDLFIGREALLKAGSAGDEGGVERLPIWDGDREASVRGEVRRAGQRRGGGVVCALERVRGTVFTHTGFSHSRRRASVRAPRSQVVVRGSGGGRGGGCGAGRRRPPRRAAQLSSGSGALPSCSALRVRLEACARCGGRGRGCGARGGSARRGWAGGGARGPLQPFAASSRTCTRRSPCSRRAPWLRRKRAAGWARRRGRTGARVGVGEERRSSQWWKPGRTCRRCAATRRCGRARGSRSRSARPRRPQPAHRHSVLSTSHGCSPMCAHTASSVSYEASHSGQRKPVGGGPPFSCFASWSRTPRSPRLPFSSLLDLDQLAAAVPQALRLPAAVLARCRRPLGLAPLDAVLRLRVLEQRLLVVEDLVAAVVRADEAAAARRHGAGGCAPRARRTYLLLRLPLLLRLRLAALRLRLALRLLRLRLPRLAVAVVVGQPAVVVVVVVVVVALAAARVGVLLGARALLVAVALVVGAEAHRRRHRAAPASSRGAPTRARATLAGCAGFGARACGGRERGGGASAGRAAAWRWRGGRRAFCCLARSSRCCFTTSVVPKSARSAAWLARMLALRCFSYSDSSSVRAASRAAGRSPSLSTRIGQSCAPKRFERSCHSRM